MNERRKRAAGPRPSGTPHTVAALTADPANRRSHGERNLALIADALKEVGAARSIVIDEDNLILAGNGVTQAAQAVGLTKLRVVEAAGDEIIAVRRRGLTDAQKRALALFDNRTAELATWNVEQLLADQAAGLDLASYWDAAELAALLSANGTPKAGLTDPDAVPKLRATDIQRGDLFELGAHRLLCGDSNDPATVARLMGDGEPARMVWGDPPYGIALDLETQDRRKIQHWGGTAINKQTAPWDATQQVAWIPLWAAAVRKGGYLAAWGPYQGIGAIEREMLGAGLVWLNLYTWVKPQPPPGFPEYLAKSCEWSAIFRKPGSGRYVGPGVVRDYLMTDTVRGEERQGHPSPKPVAVIAPVLDKLVPPDGLVVDPFMGSGTILIVCEASGRVCAGVEFDPSWVQVTLDRWAAFTGQTPKKVGEAVRPSVTHHKVTGGRTKQAPAQAAQPPARRRCRQA